MKADFKLGALGIVFGLATRLLDRRLKSAQSAHFVENSFLVELGLEALERAINGLSFTNDYFRHIFTYFP